MPTDSIQARRRILTTISILIAIPIGFGLRFYAGPGEFWIRALGGGIMFEIFWMLAAFWIVPRRETITPIAVGVCIATCLLEVTQLWHPGWLEAIRATFIGRTVLGTTFMWSDFPAYPIGCAVGWLVLRGLTARHGE